MLTRITVMSRVFLIVTCIRFGFPFIFLLSIVNKSVLKAFVEILRGVP